MGGGRAAHFPARIVFRPYTGKIWFPRKRFVFGATASGILRFAATSVYKESPKLGATRAGPLPPYEMTRDPRWN